MRYMLLIHSDENRYADLTDEETQALMARYGQVVQDATKAGVYVTADKLRPTTAATTVRVRNGETLATDGPFAETKEQLGGYYMIEAANLDDAIAWAARIPAAEYGSIEVRPVWE